MQKSHRHDMVDLHRRLAVRKHDPPASKTQQSQNNGTHDHESDHEQRSFVFQRDEKGYGVTVYGDNPVFVTTVTPNGPARAAGLQPGDRIVKVNGTLVTKCGHIEVVDLIKSAPCVAMTIVRTRLVDPPGADINNDSTIRASTRFAPQPPATDTGEPRSARRESLTNLGIRNETETQTIHKLKQEYDANPSERLISEIARVTQQKVRTANRSQPGTPAQPQFVVDQQQKPPTPPPIERIPRHHDDLSSPRLPGASGINRRRSNPEVMHLGVSRMALNTADLPDFAALTRSPSAIHMGKPDRRDSIPDEPPPALPAKKRMEPRPRNMSLKDDSRTPSGSPPPPYPDIPITRPRVPISGSFPGASMTRPAPGRQLEVMTMEMEDQILSALDVNQGPFSEFSALQKNLPHLSVFLNYLIAHSNANALLFYLITDTYPKGSSKEMTRWAYEIHSTFLVPNAPLEVLTCANCDHSHRSIIEAIDEVLIKPDKEDVLRDVFTAARSAALDIISKQLLELQNLRTIGMASRFGPPDNELDEAVGSTERTRDIVDSLLGQHLESIASSSADEPENRSDSAAATGCALATFLKMKGIKANRDGAYLVDKWPLFVQKDKSKFKLKDKSKKSVNVSGHQFAPVSFMTISFCSYCGIVMWGVGPQGYQCDCCEYIVHRGCVKIVEEPCIGDKKERRSFISMDSFGLFGRKRSNNSPTAIANAKKAQDEKEELETPTEHVNPELSRDEPRGYVNQVVNRFEAGKMQEQREGSAAPVDSSTEKKAHLSAVGRSESLKAQKKQQIKQQIRKKSDPAHFYRDEAEESTGTNGNPSGISGSSSVSLQSLPSNGSSIATLEAGGIDEEDSDFEADPDQIPNWSTIPDPAVPGVLDTHARKRQDIIAELFHTEQTHVRNMKVLCKVFYMPMLREQLLSSDLIHQVFANLEEMITMHGELNKQMKRLKKESPLIGDIGNLLLTRFEGENGMHFKQAAAAFCRNQSSGLEALKLSQKKDQKLAQFLQEAASNQMCRRLQLKDIIPTGMQRLTKYPLLLENLLKHTPNETEEQKLEYEKIKTALASSKEILDFVNQAVSDSTNLNRLRELQDKIDMTHFFKSPHKLAIDYKNLDLLQYRLLFDGDLIWRQSKQKSVDLHVILLHKILILVTKQDDKLLLKFHVPPVGTSVMDKKTGESFTEKKWAPIISLDGLFVKDVATDSKAFFLFSNDKDTGAQMFEMVANSVNEQKQWTRHILAAVERVTKCYETIPEIFPTTATASVTPALPMAIVPADSHDGAVAADSDDGSHEETVDYFYSGELNRAQLLTSPSDVVVTLPNVMDAELVLTPMEKLRRSDDELEESLQEKQRLVSQILGISESNVAAEESSDVDGAVDIKHVLHRVIRHSDSLTRLVKDSFSVMQEEIREKRDGVAGEPAGTSGELTSEPGTSVESSVQTDIMTPYVSAEALKPITSNLTRQLTALMALVCRQQEDNEHLRDELSLAKEQLRRTLNTESRSPNLSPTGSCASFTSVQSGLDDDLEEYLDESHDAEGDHCEEANIPANLSLAEHVEVIEQPEKHLDSSLEEIQHL